MKCAAVLSLGTLALTVLPGAGADAAKDGLSHFTLVASAEDASIDGTSLFATDNEEIEDEGVLEPVESGGAPATFYFDASTGHLLTDSQYTGDARVAFSINPNYTGSVRFDVSPDTTSYYYPPFSVCSDGTLCVANLTWAWCPDDFGVGDGVYLPGSFTLGEVAEGCEAVKALNVVAAS